MTDEIVTSDLSKFGYRELAIAGKLLSLYAEGKRTADLGDKVTVNFNLHSGYVFLSDEDCNVLVLNDNETQLVRFLTCSYCGAEGDEDELTLDENGNCPDCKGK